eukprot:gene56340-43151_t
MALWSSSKLPATVAILRVMEARGITLDDPVRRFLPEFWAKDGATLGDNDVGVWDATASAPGRWLGPGRVAGSAGERDPRVDVTIRHLLSFTSGFHFAPKDGTDGWFPEECTADFDGATLAGTNYGCARAIYQQALYSRTFGDHNRVAGPGDTWVPIGPTRGGEEF